MPLGDLIADLRDESGLWDALSVDEGGEADAVRTVFAWSYRALPPDAAHLFCLLGLHPGGSFGKAAALALSGHGRLRGSLDALVDSCLLETAGRDRYRFHDLLRAYAIDRSGSEISQEDQLAAVRRACLFYLHSAYRCVQATAHDTTLLPTPDPAGDIPAVTFDTREQADQWYEEEKSNLVGAVQAAVGTGHLELALQLATVLERIYASHNHFGDWRVTSEIGLAAARKLARPSAEAGMYESLGRLCRMRMQLDEAADHYAHAVAVHRREGTRSTSSRP